MVDLLETIMIFCWGLSWPVNIHKSWTSRTAKGKSILFEFLILFGYICGIWRKIILVNMGGDLNWLFYLSYFFYVFNSIEVLIDMLLYVRNRRLDEIADKKMKEKQ